jgi:hypothetical protein
MNPQPHPFVGQLGVLIFALLVAYFALRGKNNVQISDKFVVGYVDPPEQKIVYVEKETEKPSTKPKNKKKTVTYDQELYDDCISAMISLGTKHAQANRIAKKIFENHNPSTVEEFITLAFKI